MDDILAEFIAETRETLEAIAGELVAWESDPADRERLDKIFRFVHTVKGSCGFLDLPRLEKLSHAAEDALSAVREGQRTADEALVSAVLGIVDRIAELAEALDTGEAVPGTDEHLIAALSEDAPVPDAAKPAEPVQRGAMRSIRISLDLLDRMMGGVSDLVLARNELARRLHENDPDPALESAFERLSICVADMRDTITRTRMQRIEKLFASAPRMVRDLASELGKSVELKVEGGDVELDREMIELIRDPLTHIIRNALDHGIETAEQRVRAGKTAQGRLSIGARQSGNQIVIEVADDGRGLDGDKIVSKAIAAGIITAETASGLSARARLDLIFAPGLSTADTITSLSGRGVGMDVVRANIERIGGVVDVESAPGEGVTLIMRVPLTLSIIPALTVGASGHQFALPRSAIQEIVRDTNAAVRIEQVGEAVVVRLRDQHIPVVEIEAILGLTRKISGAPRSLIVINPSGGASYALSVAELHDHQELVIRPACPSIMSTGVYAGMTLPDTGVPMLLLDPAGIAEKAGVVSLSQINISGTASSIEEEKRVSTLLFRDLDGAERAVRLGVVERIEDVSRDQVKFGAGRMRLAMDGRIMPLIGVDALGDRELLSILRLNDGQVELAYAIEEVIDIVSLPTAISPAANDGIVAGVALLDGRQIELLDPHWLFAEAIGAVQGAAEHPICLLTDEDDLWTREVLRPLVEAAGYRVVFAKDAGAVEADVVIASEGAEAEPTSARVLRLRSDLRGNDPSSIYRYDRAGLMSALQAGRAGKVA